MLLLASILAFAPPAIPVTTECVGPVRTVPSDSLRQLYEQGKSFPEFLAAASSRKAQWEGNYVRSSGIDATLVARARAVGGTWRILIVAVDSCSDSVNTVPYLARLAELSPDIQVRIVEPAAGRWVQESHRTPDDRAATPTVILMDANWNEVGCFIERPTELRTWLKDNSDKMKWYDEDAGRTTVEQFVETLEAAARGERICR